MKKRMIVLLAGIFAYTAQAQAPLTIEKPEVGTVYKIGEATSPQFEHIKFPRPNFIIKRGGLVNYKAMEDVKVVVASVKKRKDGGTKVHLKRADGKRFFGSHVYVEADFDGAVQSGELLR